MPTTYNGIGTHYYGRKNSKSRRGVCQLCGHEAELSSYETRLWFVIFFIPVFPFGRKRITDRCSVCSRHYAIPAKGWETSRQADTAAAMDRFRREQSQEAALDVHGQLLRFQQHEEAAEFRESMLERFSDKALLRAGFAAHLDSIGLPKEAAELWDQAYERDPELPEVRIGMAQRRMRENKLDEARDLLRFLEESGAEKQHNLESLFELAGRYQAAGRHEETLELFQVLLTAYPHAATDHQIRSHVQKSEKALQKSDSILPPLEPSIGKLFSSQYSSNQRWAVGIAVALVLVTIGLMINNEYIRRHRPLTVINATGVPAQIQLDDQPAVTVQGMQTLTMAEGDHVVRVSGPIEEQHQLSVSSGYWQRWSKNPVWLVNVGGEGIIADVLVRYAVNPQPPTVHLLSDPLIVREHVDHPFEDPPESVEVSNDRDIRTRSTLSWVDLGAAEHADIGAFYALKQENAQQARNYAERRLRRMPSNSDLLRVLLHESQPEDYPWLRTLLETGLEHRPVEMQWHRTYQDLPAVSRDYDQVLAVYDRMLAADPDNARLVYLRGRFDKDPAAGEEQMARAAELEPNLAQAQYSLAHRAGRREDWQTTLDLIAKAEDLGMRQNEVIALRHTAMLNLQKYEAWEEQLRGLLSEDPQSVGVAGLLAELLILQNRTDDAEKVVTETVDVFRRAMGTQFQESALGCEALLAYFRGDATRCLEICGSSPHLRGMRQMVDAETRHAEFAAEHTWDIDRDDVWLPLYCSLGFYAAGDQARCDEWRQKLIQQLSERGPRFDSWRELFLLAPEQISADLPERVRQLSDSPTTASMILAALALHSEDAGVRSGLTTEARRLLIRRIPPYGLIDRVLQKLAGQQ
ncbi:MAG: hypothetical protein KDA89_17790 [Planctomycetaceae bacterium]|nr:hypothetical protein [Planctomycetaceae bacterium]